MTTGKVMRPLLAAACVAALTAALIIGSGGDGADAEPPTATSFAFAIGNKTLNGTDAQVGARYEDFDLVAVDGEDASAGQVAEIEAGGATVLAYLSVGTIESYRSWYGKLKRFRLSAWQDWRDEWFADTSRGKYRKRILAIAEERILNKGFDGLFLDNVDMVEVKRHRKQRAGMGLLVAALDELVDAEDGYLFAQNGAPGVLDGYPNQGVAPLSAHLDGWNREDVTFAWDFDRRHYKRVGAADHEAAVADLKAIGDLGVLTSATDYVNLDNASVAAECEAVSNAVVAGALPYVADIGLTVRAVEENPPVCP